MTWDLYEAEEAAYDEEHPVERYELLCDPERGGCGLISTVTKPEGVELHEDDLTCSCEHPAVVLV